MVTVDCQVCKSMGEEHKIEQQDIKGPCVDCGLIGCQDFVNGRCGNCTCDGCGEKADWLCNNNNCYYAWCKNCCTMQDCELCESFDVKIHKYVCNNCRDMVRCENCDKTGPQDHFLLNSDSCFLEDKCEICRDRCHYCHSKIDFDLPFGWNCHMHGCSKQFCGECEEGEESVYSLDGYCDEHWFSRPRGP